MSPKIAILVPCYNEENHINNMISKLNKLSLPYLFVNDGSTDCTHKILHSIQCPYIEYYPNKGKGYAIKKGAKHLIAQGYDYILIIDSDEQNDMNDYSQFVNVLKIHPDAKIVIGNRFHNPQNMPTIRYYTNKCMSWIISKLAHQKITDTQCGFRLVHKEVFKIRTKSLRFEYESEQLIKAGRKGYKIVSTPIKCIYFKDRKSKIRPLQDTFRFFKMLLNIYLIK